MSIKPIWNEKYLKAGKLIAPKYVDQWKQGLAHVAYGAKRQFPVLIILFALIVFNEFFLFEISGDDLIISAIIHLIEALLECALILAISYPIILSSWADLKGKDISDLNYSKWKMPLKIVAVSTIYSLAGLFLCLLFVLPGIWFSVVFSFAIVILAIDETSLKDSFYRSMQLVRGNFFNVFIYLGLWPFLICLILTFITMSPLLALKEVDFLYNLVSMVGSLAINLIELTFIPPMVYMFAYLTDRKLHRLN